jgi:hypothetical protein
MIDPTPLHRFTRLHYPLVMLLLLMAAYAAWWPAIASGFISDDLFAMQLLSGSHFSSQDFQEGSFFMPAMTLSMQLLYALFGTQAAGYHIFLIAVHALNAFLLYAITLYFLRHWLKIEKGPVFLALAVALLFLLSPYQTEAVTWISSIGFTLSLFFELLSVLLFLVWLNKGKWHWLLFSFLLYIVAILEKEIALVLPLGFLLIAVYHDAYRRTPAKRLFGRILLLGAISTVVIAAYFLWRHTMIGQWIGHYGSDVHLSYTAGGLAEAYAVYHVKFFLCYRYLSWLIRPLFYFLTQHPWVILICAGVIGFLLWLMRKAIASYFREGRWKPVLLFYLLFLLFLVPVINLELSSLSEIQSDRYSYHASAWFAVLGVLLLYSLLPRAKSAALFCLIPLVFFFILCRQENCKWAADGRLIDRIYSSLQDHPPHCKKVYFLGVPDTYLGVYTLRGSLQAGAELRGICKDCEYIPLVYTRIHRADADIQFRITDDGVAIHADEGAGLICRKPELRREGFSLIIEREGRVLIRDEGKTEGCLYFINSAGSVIPLGQRPLGLNRRNTPYKP